MKVTMPEENLSEIGIPERQERRLPEVAELGCAC